MYSKYFSESGPKENIFTIAFYNLDNLFDIFDDPDTLDDDFTPTGYKKWTYKRYKNKLLKMGQVISKIGSENSKQPPVIIGVAELENESVLIDLIESKHLKNHPYDYVHYDSPDERGIDVGFIYHKEHFEYISSKQYPLIINEPEGDRDYTRDILLVKGKLKGELMHILVNHWPSRREGIKESDYKRLTAAHRVNEIVKEIQRETSNANIIVMGDFNDCYNSKSVQEISKKGFYNPMERLRNEGNGTSVFNNEWYLFDQILFSENFIKNTNQKLRYRYADIYDPKFIRTWRGKRKNKPFRTFIGRWHQGGYSDHFPVYAYIEHKK